jgi:putative metallohydrolase (TIGR04338 family)
MTTVVAPPRNVTQAVYAGEHSLAFALDRANEGYPYHQIAGSVVILPQERKFASIESIQTYIAKVLALPTIQATYPAAQVIPQVRERKGDLKATYSRSKTTISIPIGSKCSSLPSSRWALRELVVLHELAHHLSPHLADLGHGPDFRSTFLTLINICISPEAAFILRVAWAQEGLW